MKMKMKISLYLVSLCLSVCLSSKSSPLPIDKVIHPVTASQLTTSSYSLYSLTLTLYSYSLLFTLYLLLRLLPAQSEVHELAGQL